MEQLGKSMKNERTSAIDAWQIGTARDQTARLQKTELNRATRKAFTISIVCAAIDIEVTSNARGHAVHRARRLRIASTQSRCAKQVDVFVQTGALEAA